MMDKEKALQIIWDRCQHSKETEKALEVLKEERPHGEWIPCSEKLPKRNELVLVSFKTGMVKLCEYLDDGSNNPWYSLIDECFAWNNVVNAWMSLPEPYREEASECAPDDLFKNDHPLDTSERGVGGSVENSITQNDENTQKHYGFRKKY